MIFDFFNNFFTNIFNILNRQDNHMIMMAVYLCIVVGVIFLRVLTRLRLGAALLAFRRDARELATREDVKKLRNTLLRKIVAAYKQVADKAVTRIPTSQIINRLVDNLRFAGFRYGGITSVVEGFEVGLLAVGVLLAVVFHEYAHIYGVITAAGFLIMRIFAAIFDYKAARAALCDEMYIYIEREVGRFYASDSGGAVLRLKNELSEAQNRTTDALSASLAHLTNALTENAANLGNAIKEATQNIHTQIAESVDAKIINMNESLEKTTQNWEKALTEAATVQTTINNSADAMSKAGGRLQSSAELLGAHLQGHSNALSDQLIQLVRAIETVKESVAILAAQQDVLTKQASYIERNQATLETALTAYEASLQNLTQNLGDGLGAFINLHAENSAQAVNDALRGNLERIMQLSQRGEAP